jgi:orotate phosphoribosyltransferase-like protein
MILEDSIRKALIEMGALTLHNSRHYTLLRQALCVYPRQLGYLASILAGHFHRREIRVVVGAFMSPSSILAAAVSHELDRLAGPTKTAFVSEELNDGSPRFFLQEFYRPVVEGKNVLIIDDFTTDPDWTRKIISEVRHRGGRVVGLGVIAETTGDFDKIFDAVPYRYALLRSHQLLG